LPLGFWKQKPVKLTKQKVSVLLQADAKRKRNTYDSFKLFEERKSEASEPYIMDEILLDSNFNYPLISVEKFQYLDVNRFITEEFE
jgi:hypothetical protein